MLIQHNLSKSFNYLHDLKAEYDIANYAVMLMT